jgi:prepilin-type N-terminal cleavage/methylation domain-containing protein
MRRRLACPQAGYTFSLFDQTLETFGDEVGVISRRRLRGLLRNELMVSRKNNGFSMLEMMITISISLILMAVTYMTLGPIWSQGHINEAYGTTLMVLRNTRNLAIAQGNEYYVNFNPAGFPAGTIQVMVQPYNSAGVAQPQQQVITYSIPPDMVYNVQSGFPASAPDGFGSGVLPIDFGQQLAGEPLNYVVFYPDGSSQDGLGNYNNGIIYMTQTGKSIYTSRAVTVWGATGRIRGWRLSQVSGVATWVQQ